MITTIKVKAGLAVICMTEEVVRTQATLIPSKVGEETVVTAMTVARNLLIIPVIKIINTVSHQTGVDTKVGLKIAMGADYFKSHLRGSPENEQLFS